VDALLVKLVELTTASAFGQHVTRMAIAATYPSVALIVGRCLKRRPRGPFHSTRRFSIHFLSRAPETARIFPSATTSNVVDVAGSESRNPGSSSRGTRRDAPRHSSFPPEAGALQGIGCILTLSITVPTIILLVFLMPGC
jgi:hypothetical protein